MKETAMMVCARVSFGSAQYSPGGSGAGSGGAARGAAAPPNGLGGAAPSFGADAAGGAARAE